MVDFVTGKTAYGNGASSQDHIAAFESFTNTPAFQTTMSNPIAREQFIRMTESKKEFALKNGDNELFNLCGSLVTAAKQYVQGHTTSTATTASSTDGTRFDSAKIFAV